MTLYELTDEYKTLLEMAEDPDVDEQTLADTMEAIEGEIEDKADGYACVIRQMEYDAAAIDAEIKRLTNRKKTAENNIRRMKESLQNAMVATGKVKFKTPRFSFSFRKSEAVIVTDESRVSHDYLKPQPPKIDLVEIKKALKDGFHFDWAHIEERQSLQIR